MGFTRQYNQENNFMLTKIIGDINDEDLFHHVIALNKEVEDLINLKELADCREITKINLSTSGTTTFANMEKNKAGSKLAILTPKGNNMIFAMARAYQMFSENYREHVQIFKNYNQAIDWLTKENSHETESINEFIKNA